MASPIQSGRVTNFVGQMNSVNYDLASGGVVTSGNTRRVFVPTASGYWLSFRPGRTFNGFSEMTRARLGTSEDRSGGTGNCYLYDSIASYSISGCVPIATVPEGSGTTPSAAARDVEYIATINGFDRIPNYALTSPLSGLTTRSTIQSGLWSATSTWSGSTVPVSGNIVRIESGVGVVYDISGANIYPTVSVENYGLLKFWNSGHTRMIVQNLQVRELGELQIGHSGSPIASGIVARVSFADVPVNSGFDPNQYGNGLVVVGSVQTCGQDRGLSYIKVASGTISGATNVTLWSGHSWLPGDRLYVPDTRQLNTTQQNATQVSQTAWHTSGNWELRNMASGTGTSLFFNSGLTYQHATARNNDGTAASGLLWHVMNLNRNVIFDSVNASGTPGHTIYTGHARVDVRNTLFYELGRTIASGLNNTTFNSSGNPTSFGTNQIGRYPFHMHHCGGRQPITVSGEHYQFVCMGNAVDGGDTYHNRKWGITVHRTHWGLIENNALHNVFGGGYVVEDGSETMNTFQRNMVARVPGLFGREDNDDSSTGFARNGGGIWCRNGLSRYKDNVAANCGAFSFIINSRQVGNVNLPVFAGAHYHAGDSDGIVAWDNIRNSTLDFDGIEGYGYMPAGITFWWLCTTGSAPQVYAPRAEFKNGLFWHYNQYGVYTYENSKVSIVDWIIRGDLDLFDGNYSTYGVWPGDYPAQQMIFEGCDIQNVKLGIECSPYLFDTHQIIGCLIRAVESIRWNMPATPAAGAFSPLLQQPRIIRIEGSDLTVTSRTITGSPTKTEVNANFITSGGQINYVVQNDFYITNRTSGGTDHRLYATQQSASGFLVPTEDLVRIGCPEAGLTNLESKTKYNPWSVSDGYTSPGIKSDNPNSGTPGLCVGGAIAASGSAVPSWTNALVEDL